MTLQMCLRVSLLGDDFRAALRWRAWTVSVSSPALTWPLTAAGQQMLFSAIPCFPLPLSGYLNVLSEVAAQCPGASRCGCHGAH